MTRLIVLLAAFLVLVTASAPVGAAPQLRTVITFSEAAGELPEGIAADPQGNLYLGMLGTGEIRQVARNGQMSTYAQLPSPGGGFMTGLAFDSRRDLFVGMASFDPATHGIWRVSRDGQMSLWAPMALTSLPNWLDFYQGDLMVSDTLQGSIWRFDAAGNGSVWVQSPLLMGDVARSTIPLPLGANGFAIRGNAMYVANTNFARIVRVPIRGGRAGTPEVWIENEALLYGIDGITFDRTGTLYAAVNGRDAIVAISRDRQITVLARDGILQSPASVVVSRNTLYITNMAFAEAPGTRLPALLAIDLDDVDLDDDDRHVDDRHVDDRHDDDRHDDDREERSGGRR